MFLHVSVILLTGGGACSNFFGGVLFSGGGCSNFWGGIFSGGVPAPIFRGGLQFSEYGHRSAGTHPTGMHSCFSGYLLLCSLANGLYFLTGWCGFGK